MEKYWEFTGNEIEEKNGVKLKEIRCTRAIVINTLSANGFSVTAPNFQDTTATDSMIEDELIWKETIYPGEIGGYISDESNLAQDGTSWVGRGAKIVDSPYKNLSRIEDNTYVSDSYVQNSYVSRSYAYKSIIYDSKIQTEKYTRLRNTSIRHTDVDVSYLSLDDLAVHYGTILTSINLTGMNLFNCMIIAPTDIFYCMLPGVEPFGNNEFRIYHTVNGIALSNYGDFGGKHESSDYQYVCSPSSGEEFLQEVAKIYGNDIVNNYRGLFLDVYNNTVKDM